MFLPNFKQRGLTMLTKTTLSLTAIREAGRAEIANFVERLIDLWFAVSKLHADLDEASERGQDPLDVRYFWGADSAKIEIERALAESILLATGNGPPPNVAMNDVGWVYFTDHPPCELFDDREEGSHLTYGVDYGEDEETGDRIPHLTVTA